MKVTRYMKINDVLAIDEEKALDTLELLSSNFERLRHPRLRRAMGGRISVEQAAKVAGVPITEMLYVLNITLGEDEERLSEELAASDVIDFDFHQTNPPVKPSEIIDLVDTDPRVNYIDLMPFHSAKRDPMRVILRGWKKLNSSEDILLIKHPFDPIPLRELFRRRFEMASWAEERIPGEWYIYFYHPISSAKAEAHPPVRNQEFRRTFVASAR